MRSLTPLAYSSIAAGFGRWIIKHISTTCVTAILQVKHIIITTYLTVITVRHNTTAICTVPFHQFTKSTIATYLSIVIEKFGTAARSFTFSVIKFSATAYKVLCIIKRATTTSYILTLFSNLPTTIDLSIVIVRSTTTARTSNSSWL